MTQFSICQKNQIWLLFYLFVKHREGPNALSSSSSQVVFKGTIAYIYDAIIVHTQSPEKFGHSLQTLSK